MNIQLMKVGAIAIVLIGVCTAFYVNYPKPQRTTLTPAGPQCIFNSPLWQEERRRDIVEEAAIRRRPARKPAQALADVTNIINEATLLVLSSGGGRAASLHDGRRADGGVALIPGTEIDLSFTTPREISRLTLHPTHPAQPFVLYVFGSSTPISGAAPDFAGATLLGELRQDDGTPAMLDIGGKFRYLKLWNGGGDCMLHELAIESPSLPTRTPATTRFPKQPRPQRHDNRLRNHAVTLMPDAGF